MESWMENSRAHKLRKEQTNMSKRENGNILRGNVSQTDAPIHPIFREKECYCITLHIIEAPYRT